MHDQPTFAELLSRYMAEMGPKGWGPDRLASATGIHRSTIVGWRRGQVPRDWQEVLRLARALGRDADSTDALLKAAKHPSRAQLRRLQSLSSEEQQLLAFWDAAQTQLPVPEGLAASDDQVAAASPPLPAASPRSPRRLMVVGFAVVLVLVGGLLVALVARDQAPSARVSGTTIAPTTAAAMALATAAPSATAAPPATARLMYTDRQGANLDQVTFYWNPTFGNGTIYVEVCTRAAAYWITSRELHPNPKIWGLYPHAGRNGCDGYRAAAMGVLIGDVMEIGIGAGPDQPQKTGEDVEFAQLPGTRFYRVTRVDKPQQELQVELIRVVPPAGQ
jgi:hypothetical protein